MEPLNPIKWPHLIKNVGSGGPLDPGGPCGPGGQDGRDGQDDQPRLYALRK